MAFKRATTTYSYLANSSLVSNIVFSASGITRMTTTKTHDYLNRLTEISSVPSSTGILPVSFSYSYNPPNQRTHDTLADGSYWVYAYDSLGQVTNGCKYFSDGTPVAGQQFDYTFDTIGNRTQTQSGGDGTGANLRVANYYANRLNQITNRDVPPYVDITGASILTNTVSVNGQTVHRKQEYYRAQIPANNTSTALWTNIIVSGGRSITGNVYVAKEPELLKYDADGNLTNDGRWSYTWDAENRLIGMTNNSGVGPAYQLTFAYDSKSRRIQKVVTTNGIAFTTNSFLYDGWNLVAVLSQISNLQSSYTWGSDLSSSKQGAGGVGGLLAIGYHGTSTTNAVPAYDGNGNISALVIAANGTTIANYDYGPFGEFIKATGPMAKLNPFRFSTKYQDDESDLVIYPARPYNPSTGRWLSRDPIEERGGPNLYGFVANNPISYYDLLGLDTEMGPLSPDGQHIDDEGSIFKDRHNSYVTFHATCPACSRVSNVRIDYGNMCACMYAAFLQGQPGWNGTPGQWPNPPKSQQEYCQQVMSLLGSGGFGGVRSPNGNEGNCAGKSQEIQAYMRTRLVSPSWIAALYRFANDLPTATQTASCYLQNTKAYYHCTPCGN